MIIVYIIAIIILVAVIIIAITGNRNLNNFRDSIDNSFNEAQRDAQDYIDRLNKKD